MDDMTEINLYVEVFPKLFKKTNTGAIQSWLIMANENPDGTGTIVTVFGQVDGKLQQTQDTIKEGKNPGKANATTAWEQCKKETEAKWLKQKKKGYVESIEAAQAGEVDAVIEGGVAPMLAPNKLFNKEEKLAAKIKYPAFCQPKLDGMRCVTIIDYNEGVSLWSRTRKRIKTVPHIEEQLWEHLKDRIKDLGGGLVIPDGELYNHEFRNDFQGLLSILRGDAPDSAGEYLKAQYHIYDMVDDRCFADRINYLHESLFPNGENTNAEVKDYPGRQVLPSVFLVDTRVVRSKEEALKYQEDREIEEYEGAMIRDGFGLYESGKRSNFLLKMKSFLDSEFKIVGADEGRGKDTGTVGAFVCVTDDNKEFRCRLKTNYAERTKLWNNPKLWEGKKLTVRYKRLTNDGIPYIPIGQGIREDV